LHMIPAISFTKDKRRIVVDYDNLIADPVRQLRRISDALGLAVGNELSESIAEYTEEFLVKEMRHTFFNPDQILNDRKIPGLIAEVYTLLLNLSGSEGDPDDFLDTKRWGEVEKKFESLAPIYGFLDLELNKLQETYKLVDQEIRRYAASEQALLEVVAKKNQELAEQGKHIEMFRQEIGRKASELEQQDATVRSLLEAVAKKDWELSEQGRHIEMFREEIARKASELEQQDKTVRSLLDTVANKDRELSVQGEHIEKFREEIARKESEIDHRDKANNSLIDSIAQKDSQIADLNRQVSELLRITGSPQALFREFVKKVWLKVKGCV
jgi:DNA repair exonuclease SbcCD ATPase subunit